MSRVLLFNMLQMLASGYALMRGGAPERLAGIALLAAAFATRMFGQQSALPFSSIEFGVLIVDLTLMAVLLILVLYADRWWTFWAAALHVLGLGAHLARVLSPDIERVAYAILTAAWSYPMLMLLVAGTYRHQQRKQWLGVDRDWSGLPPDS